MNVGVGAGDFVALVGLAWTVYKSCKDAPDSFGSISYDVLSLHALLKETEETVLQQPLAELSKERLNSVLQGCYAVLNDLEKLLEKYGSLGTQTRRTWDRMRWSAEHAAELRARLTSSTILLTGFIATSQVTVQKKLDKFAQDCQDGNLEPSVISTHTIESISADDKEAWRQIRKELESIGITVEAFNENKTFIINWFMDAMANGIFEGLRLEDSLEDSEERVSEIRKEILDYPVASSPQQHMDNHDSPEFILQDDEAGISPPEPTVSAVTQGRPSATIKSKANETSHPLKKQTRMSKIAVFIRKTLGQRVLVAAVQGGEINIVRTILEDEDSSALVNVKTLSNALNIALSLDNAEMTKLLLERGAVSNRETLKNTLYRATEWNNVEIIKSLMETGTAFDGAALGVTLKIAHDWNSDKLFALLLKGGVAFDAINSTEIPLLWAAREGHLETTLSLLEKEADVNERNPSRRTALHEAASCNKLNIAEVLLNNGANPDLVDSNGLSPLTEGVRHNDLKVVKLLLNNGANPNLVDGNGISPLMESVRRNYLNLGELLLDKGANPNLADVNGVRPLIEAASLILTELFLEALLDKGANIDAQTREGETALMIASRHLKFDHMRILLRHGAKVNLSNRRGKTALEILLREKERRPDDPAVIMLRKHGAVE